MLHGTENYEKSSRKNGKSSPRTMWVIKGTFSFKRVYTGTALLVSRNRYDEHILRQCFPTGVPRHISVP